jgi:hypothetical protein
MATMLEECTAKEHCSVVPFLWAKGHSAKDIHKEMFPVYGGKCLSRKALYYWVEKFSQGRSKLADDARSGAEVDETTVKRLLYCDGTSVSMLVEDLSRNKCFLPGSNIICFAIYVYI